MNIYKKLKNGFDYFVFLYHFQLYYFFALNFYRRIQIHNFE